MLVRVVWPVNDERGVLSAGSGALGLVDLRHRRSPEHPSLTASGARPVGRREAA